MDERLDTLGPGSVNEGLATSPPGMMIEEDGVSNPIPNPDSLRLMPSMSAVAAQALIKSAHKLLDHPPRDPRKVAETSDDEDLFDCMASIENEGQIVSHPEDEGKEDDIDSLADLGDPAIQAQ